MLTYGYFMLLGGLPTTDSLVNALIGPLESGREGFRIAYLP
jgi:hypothetical protein